MSGILRMETDVVRTLANHLTQSSDDIESILSSTKSAAINMEWESPSRYEFTSVFEGFSQQLYSLLQQSRELSQRVLREVQEWEQTAAQFGDGTDNGSSVTSPIQNGERKDLNKEYDEFTVPTPDPEGMVSVPDKWIADLLDLQQQKVTTAEKELLDALDPVGKLKFYNIYKEALGNAKHFENGNLTENGVGDAYRHVFWNAMMAKEFGAEWAKKYSTAHESCPENPKTQAFMDMWNNQIGVQLALDNPNLSKQELSDTIAELVRSGKTVIIDPSSQKPVYSDQATNIQETQDPIVSSY